MRATRLDPGCLSPADRARWAELQERAPFDSPFFAPGLVAALAQVRDDVELIRFEDQNGVAGYLGLQAGRPLAGRMADLHGPLGAPGLDLKRAIAAAGLGAIRFDHLPAEVDLPRVTARARARTIDLSDGFEAFAAQRGAAGSRWVQDSARRARRLARELGPLELRFDVDDDGAWESLLRWKSAQRVRTNTSDPFDEAWVPEFLRTLRARSSSECHAPLTTLRAGGRLVAVHLGLRGRGVLHWWLPAYDWELRALSPGSVMTLEWLRAAAEQGVQRVELGKGDERFKERLATGHYGLVEGFVASSPMARTRQEMRGAVTRIARTKAGRWLRGVKG